ncbi:MAG TPA: YoaK family protein [Terriglobales bacterium]
MSDAIPRPLREFGSTGLTLLSSQGARALPRALIAGYVDSYALLNFGVFASFMTGNTTTGGLHAGQANLAAAGHSLLPIPFFLLGIPAGTLLVRADQHRALTRTSLLVAAMLALAVAWAYLAWPGWLGIVILSSAMGIMNTPVTHVGGQPARVCVSTCNPQGR